MTQEQFDDLIKRLENFARKHPITYKFRVGCLAVLGYAYIFSIVAALLAFCSAIALLIFYSRRINVVIIQLAIFILIPVFVVLRSLWVTFPAPTGLEVNRKDVPDLFKLIDELTVALQAPQFHFVLLDKEFNASVRQRPRLGIFGWCQNYLILGLPLMHALSPEQFRAVLAHELGHLSGNHSRFAAWIYRLRKIWEQILARLHHSGHRSSSLLFEWFLNWYGPFFNAYSFVLARMNEYEADRCAATIAGMRNTSEALINVEIKHRFLETSFWPSVYNQVDCLIEPPTAAFTNMFTALHTNVEFEDVSKWLEQALKEKTNTADTHPCLADRLFSLGYLLSLEQQLSLPDPIKVSAAEQFLGDTLEQLTVYFDRLWKEEISTPWRQRYVYVQESLNNLQALEHKAQTQPLTLEEAWKRASLTVEFKQEAAIPLLQDILKTQPEHIAANYTLGEILLQQHDVNGIDYVEKAIAKDSDIFISGCELIYCFLKQQEQLEAAENYQQRANHHYELLLKAQHERSDLRKNDQFMPQELSDDCLQYLYQVLSNYSQIKQVYLVQKVVKYFPEKPFHILGIVRNRGFFELDSSHKEREILTQLVNELPPSIFIILLNDNTKYWENKFRKVAGAIIYSTKKKHK